MSLYFCFTVLKVLNPLMPDVQISFNDLNNPAPKMVHDCWNRWTKLYRQVLKQYRRPQPRVHFLSHEAKKKIYYWPKVTYIKGIPKSATRGAFHFARSKKEDIPLAENDVKRHFRPMECLLFFFSPKFSIYWWPVNADFGSAFKCKKFQGGWGIYP